MIKDVSIRKQKDLRGNPFEKWGGGRQWQPFNHDQVHTWGYGFIMEGATWRGLVINATSINDIQRHRPVLEDGAQHNSCWRLWVLKWVKCQEGGELAN